MKDKTTRLLEAIDRLDLFDEEELKKMLDDPETAEIYAAISKIADALTETSRPDIDKEWDAFAESNFPVKRREANALIRGILSRKAASVAIIAFATLSIVAAGIGITYTISNKTDVKVSMVEDYERRSRSLESVTQAQDSVVKENFEIAESSIVIFKDATLGQILKEISDYYGTSVVFESDRVKGLRLFFQWDKANSLTETAAQLNNFQQIDIAVLDNSIIVR